MLKEVAIISTNNSNNLRAMVLNHNFGAVGKEYYSNNTSIRLVVKKNNKKHLTIRSIAFDDNKVLHDYHNHVLTGSEESYDSGVRLTKRNSTDGS